ncbi:START domain-containing protein [Piscinibacter sakaiensis]|uniref:START domain-containing protein n=1 Tax=Piscinibacter sakaiensis TaxID=1547922 RepID=UPI003AAAF232
MRRCLLAALLLALIALGPPARAQSADDWVLQREDAQTQTRVWLANRPGVASAFRATTVVDASLSALTAVLLDSERMPDWVYRVRETQRVRSDGPTRGVSLVVTSMPFPLLDRDAVVAWSLTQHPQTLVVTLAGRQADGLVPPHPERIRMPLFESRWVFSPRADGRVDVLFEGAGDPGGNLALPVLREIVGSLSWQAPWQTILALREIVREPGYAQARLPFIREPAR